MTIQHQYPDFSIIMHSYLLPVESRSFTRKEHISHTGLKPSELPSLDWAPADIPIVKKLMEVMK